MSIILVGGRLYTLARGIREQVAHVSVAAGPVARGMDSLELECALLDAGGQRRGEAAALALGGDGSIVGARSGGGDLFH